jgi:hypothetical protein
MRQESYRGLRTTDQRKREAVIGAQDEPPTAVCEPVAVPLRLWAAPVSRRGRIVSRHVRPRKLTRVSRADDVCQPPHRAQPLAC